MTNFADIQHLKNLTHCTTPQALQLLKQANNDVAQAEQLFHQQNLAFIQRQAECDRELAEKFYRKFDKFDYDTQLVVRNIQGWRIGERVRQCVITTDYDYLYPFRACFIFTVMDKNNNRIRDLDNLEKLYTIVPIEDVWDYLYNEEINMFDFYEDFDPYFGNDFSLDQVDKLIANLDQAVHADPKVMAFYQELKNWLIECKPFAHHLEIYGNV